MIIASIAQLVERGTSIALRCRGLRFNSEWRHSIFAIFRIGIGVLRDEIVNEREERRGFGWVLLVHSFFGSFTCLRNEGTNRL
jgi:hypothetical protein